MVSMSDQLKGSNLVSYPGLPSQHFSQTAAKNAARGGLDAKLGATNTLNSWVE